MTDSPLSVTSPTLWSASPTPFIGPNLKIDWPSVERLIQHHIEQGIEGIMLAGTCGEGPWMTVKDWCELVTAAKAVAQSSLKIVIQVTDNSARRMLSHIEHAAEAGADGAVIASPYFLMNATEEKIFSAYREVIDQSPLPIAYYDRGENDRYRIPAHRLDDLLSLDNLHLVKDSSCDEIRADISKEMRKKKSRLRLLTGDEFDLAESMIRGFDGGFLGGAIFNAPLAKIIMRKVGAGNFTEARNLQKKLNDLMLRIYGGPQIECWLSGLKYFLVRLGLFSSTESFLEYPLSPSYRAGIDRLFDTDEREQLVDLLLQPEIQNA